MRSYHGMCYIPRFKFLAVASKSSHTVGAFTSDNGTRAWKLEGLVDGRAIHPHNLVYLAEQQTVLVADGRNHRVLVLADSDGALTNVIDFPREMGVAVKLVLDRNYVALQHQKQHRADEKAESPVFISYLQIEAKK